jgi:polyferredoxin
MFSQHNLKKLRVFVSIVFLLSISFIFLDSKETFPAWFRESFLFLQLIPSVIQFATIIGWLAFGFLVVIILTLLFGRVYCSFICPLGILQDIITRISNLFRKKKRRFRFLKARNILRYSLLIIIVAASFSGFIIVLGWLDPFSIFGRFMTHAVRPVYIYINNGISSLLFEFNNYWLNPIEFRAYSWASAGAVLAFMTLIVWMAAAYGRQYCNTVCPVGTFLGFLSKFSLYKIRLDQQLCNSCGLCQQACKSGCINAKEKSVDMSRCVACYNCLTACKSKGVLYSTGVSITTGDSHSASRRQFLASSASLVIATAGLANSIDQPRHENPTIIPEEKNFPVSPPGSKSLDHFISKCIACHLCVSVCPKQVLQPSLFEYGLKGFLQPRMDFHTSFCNFDCTLCGEACPSGAILPLTLDQKHVEQIGKVVFVRRNCIVRTDLTDCGACSEHCPTKAVTMVPWRRVLLIPKVNPDICIGCGACEYACPTKPFKAIYVDGNKVHQIADKPEVLEQLAAPEAEDDFPF